MLTAEEGSERHGRSREGEEQLWEKERSTSRVMDNQMGVQRREHPGASDDDRAPGFMSGAAFPPESGNGNRPVPGENRQKPDGMALQIQKTGTRFSRPGTGVV